MAEISINYRINLLKNRRTFDVLQPQENQAATEFSQVLVILYLFIVVQCRHDLKFECYCNHKASYINQGTFRIYRLNKTFSCLIFLSVENYKLYGGEQRPGRKTISPNFLNNYDNAHDFLIQFLWFYANINIFIVQEDSAILGQQKFRCHSALSA